jgi:ribonuclease R
LTKSSGKKTLKSRDPHQAREARKYDNPIPSREFILEHLATAGVPLSQYEVAEQLSLHSEDDVEALRRRLNAMERDGQVVRNRKGAFCIVNSKDLIAGRVIGHADGFGFLRPDEGGDDLFVTPRQMRQLMHGDRAVVRIVGQDRRGRMEAAVVEVLERANQVVVGRLYIDKGVGFVVPDNKRLHQDIVIPEGEFNGAGHGQMVVAAIVEQPTKRNQPIGRVQDVLGEHMAPGMETDVAIRTHQLPLEWPEEVEQEITRLSSEVEESAKKGRVDLRQLPLVTIDGADARDFDDAVYCEAKPKGWKLLVCIADVSSYVSPGSALDKEAKSRGNSVYFPDRVIPMLPEVLSNGLCSINPHVDRLCMTCELYISADGKVTRTRFYEAVMRSHARLTYDQVADMLIEGDPELCATHAELLPHLHQLYALFQVLRKARNELGAIDFDTTETRILFNDEHKVDKIIPVYRNDAHRLIEECMLAANVAAARYLIRKKMPALYRNHEGPQSEKLLDLKEFLGEMGLSLSGGVKPTSLDYASLLDQVRGRPDAHLIQTVLLRSLSQAMYSAENQGHFGLSFPAYTHFTSPIRRYPDLVVHRALKHVLIDGEAEDFEYSPSELQGLGEHCSSTERRADEATRDVISWLKCEYMMDKIGDEFVGIITTVTSFGIFVELDEIYVDGLVHITALDNDYYHFDPVGRRLTGERSGQIYRLGDQVKVRVAAVNLDDRKIDFLLVGAPEKGKSTRGKKSRRGERKTLVLSDKASKGGQKGKETAKQGMKDKKQPGVKTKTKEKDKAGRKRKRPVSKSKKV